MHDLSAINLTIIDNVPSRIQAKSQIVYNEYSNIDLSDYIDNSGWILINVSMIRREK